MLNPLSIQSLQSNSGKSLSAAELVRALPLNTPTNITVKQSVANPAQPRQFTLQVQLGSALYQLKSDQPLSPGSHATLTRTAGGQLILSTSATPGQTTQNAATTTGYQPLNQPATTQQKPIQQTTASHQSTSNQSIAPNEKPIVRISSRQKDNQPQSQRQPGQSATAGDKPIPPRQSPVSASIESRLPAQLSRQLPLNRPLLVTIENSSIADKGNPQQHNLSVRIGNQRILLNSPQTMPSGEKALLIRTSAQQVVLQPLANSADTAITQQSINNALRLTLPAQQPVASVLQQLQQLAGNTPESGRSALNSIVSSMINLFAVKTDAGSEARQSIQQNLVNGGLFTENRLTTPGGKLPTGEMKGQLGKLLQLAEKLPEQPRQQMLELVKGLLNRVTSQQLESIQNTRTNNDGGLERFFALDLPIRHGQQLDNVELKISEHRQPQTETEWQSTWRVRLHFDLQKQGTIDAELILEQEHQITARFWCSNPDMHQTMQHRLEDFNQQMRDKGFAINALHCSEGQAPKPSTSVEQLIDVTT
ncbi:flagellar hook-length control protein FliK [Amphritea sp. HPY]|uniref:flagellar hook-length control protein FliK n=1 Tax=Amphritea sp. HPY TaxID=3421652 RepID=UPI003D7EB7C8